MAPDRRAPVASRPGLLLVGLALAPVVIWAAALACVALGVAFGIIDWGNRPTARS